MRVADLEALREHMLAVIAASAFDLRDTIGKSAFDERVMTAMGNVPRHEFVPIEYQPYAYANIPLPIGFEKTISQPFLVALMTDLLDIKADDSVLEIGTGLGCQAAILAQLARWVYSGEIIEELGQAAKQRLRQASANRRTAIAKRPADMGTPQCYNLNGSFGRVENNGRARSVTEKLQSEI